MKIPRIRIGFSRYRDSALVQKVILIISMMKNNPAFASPIPTLAQVQTALDAFSAAITEAGNFGRGKAQEKDNRRRELESLLNQLGLFVMFVANGNDAIMASSGFDLVSDGQSADINAPGVVTLTNGKTSGELVASIVGVKNARGYLFQITRDPLTADSIWEGHPSTRCKVVFRNLIPGEKYWVRVGVMGSRNQWLYSPLSSLYVQ